jgi:hypothetical protein
MLATVEEIQFGLEDAHRDRGLPFNYDSRPSMREYCERIMEKPWTPEVEVDVHDALVHIGCDYSTDAVKACIQERRLIIHPHRLGFGGMTSKD